MKYLFNILLLAVFIMNFSGPAQGAEQQEIGKLIDNYFSGENLTYAEKVLVSRYLDQQLNQIKIRKLNALVNADKSEGTTVVLLGPEGFDSWVPPGWLVTTGNSNNGWGQTTNSNYGGGNDPYAFWDDDSWGSTSEDTTILISPAFSTVGYTAVTITFDYGYRSLNGTYSIEVSNDNGNTWQTVVADLPGTSSGTSAQYPESVGNIVDISAAAGQNTNVLVRFAYRDAGGWEWYGALDNVVIEGGNPPPNCAVNIAPPDGASDVYIWTNLIWANGGGGPAGYKIWFGTDGAGVTPPTNIENGTDLGNVLSYTPVASLAGNTTYYWQIVPYNTNGDATGCPIWSFTTGNDPTVTTYPWNENFENFPPGQALANGWLNAGDDDFNWDADNNGTPTGGTGPNVDHTLGTSSGIYMYTESSAPNNPNKVAHLITPPLDLSSLTTPMLKFWYHMYGSTMGELHIDVFSGGVWNLDVTTPIIGQQQTSGDAPWLESFVDLSGLRSSTGTILIRFRGITGSGFTSDMSIDDVTVMEAPTVPEFSIDPDSVGFSTVFVNDTSDTVLFTIRNTGGGTLTINSVALTGNNAAEFMLTDTNSYPVDLGIGQNITVEVAFAPTSEGAKTANLTISDNLTELIHNIPLTGIGFTGVINVFPHLENFEHNGSLPIGWLQGVNGVEDDFDWTVHVGTTPSPSTGPFGDNTTGMGYYLYTEASIPNNPFKSAHLITPDIDLSGLTYPYISFWYHMFGFSMGELHVDVWDGTTWINDVMLPLIGQQQINQGDPYLEKNFISLIPYVGSTVKVRFRAITGNDFASDMAIDDILIADAPPIPPGVPVNPRPANGEGGLSQYNTILSWNLGFFTTAIDLYFGNDSALVNDLDPSAKVLSDVLVETYAPGTIADGDYYWKIVAKNPSTARAITEGPLWKFTVGFKAPQNLEAISSDGVVELTWKEPLPEGEIRYDDGTAESWFWVANPSQVSHYFYVMFQAPVNGNITHFAILNASNGAGWQELMIAPDDGTGKPDLANPWESFPNVPVTSNIIQGGEWEVLQLTTPHSVSAGDTFYVITHWPAGSNSGPFVGTDENTNSGRSAWTGNSGVTWNSVYNSFIMRSYLATTEDKIANLVIEPAGITPELPVRTVGTESRGKSLEPLTEISQSYRFPNIRMDNDRAPTGYNIYRSTTSGVYGSPLVTTTNLFYNDNTVVNGNQYFYVVKAQYPGGESTSSNEEITLPRAATTVPYFSDLDSNDGGWFVKNGEWQWGAPDPGYSGGPSSANSVPNVWGTVLDGPYSSLSNSWLIQPFDLSTTRGGTGCLVEFSIWYNLDAGSDFGYVAIDHDNDGVYNVLVSYNGASAGWEHKQIIIPEQFCTSYAKVAFALVADGLTESGGMYIDDITVGPLPTFNQEFLIDWNMVGLPLTVDDPHYLVLYPGAIPGTLFKFSGIYQTRDTLVAGTGYWLKFPTAQTEPVAGVPFDMVTVVLDSGWNIFAGPSCNIDTANIVDPFNIVVPGTYFGFNGTYVLSDTIEQGRAYWVRTTSPGFLTLDCNISKLVKKAPGPEMDLNQYPQLEFSDARGISTTLHFDVKLESEKALLKYSLPPRPPAGAFDVRFSGDYRISREDEATILLQASQYPLTVQISNLPQSDEYVYTLIELIAGKEVARHTLKEGERMEINNPDVRTLKLTKQNLIPTEFTVYQNYPNPFNPTTTIKYAIPAATKVDVVIYNTLGQKVKTLVSANQKAGFYKVVWDATNDFGNSVGTGIYYFVVKAGNHKDIKKMVLIK